MTTLSHTGSDEPASWVRRLGAIGLDIIPGLAVVATAALVAAATPARSLLWWLCAGIAAAAVVATGFNRFVLPSICGFSIGRFVCGIQILGASGLPAGPRLLLARDIAHLLDTITVLGWLWPLRNARQGTIADIVCRTRIRYTATEYGTRNAWRYASIVACTATSLCAVLATTSYLTVGQSDREVRQARQALSSEGPRMLEQLLSYQPETIDADFNRARDLASENYQGQLSAQQQAVRTTTPVRNQYWVVKSSILDAQPDEVTMLMFLEGERGVIPDLRYLTASVRVSFIDAGAGWRLDRLVVVTAPQPDGTQR